MLASLLTLIFTSVQNVADEEVDCEVSSADVDQGDVDDLDFEQPEEEAQLFSHQIQQEEANLSDGTQDQSALCSALESAASPSSSAAEPGSFFFFFFCCNSLIYYYYYFLFHLSLRFLQFLNF